VEISGIDALGGSIPLASAASKKARLAAGLFIVRWR
jgi:hypothetical protein